jgi:hypothetical protein
VIVEFSKSLTSLTIMLELMIGNGRNVVSELDGLYGVLSKAEKRVLCGKLVGTTECIAL